MKIKTSELTGAALDWAVAKCADLSFPIVYDECGEEVQVSPSTDWAQGGPIIEREKLELTLDNDIDGSWYATANARWSDEIGCYGPTMLIAAMRCYVASKLGDSVDVPAELVEG